jgi:hypothetical protein
MGRAALDIGKAIDSLYEEREKKVEAKAREKKSKKATAKTEWVESNPDKGIRLTGYLLYQIVPGLKGQDGVRDSGIGTASNLGSAVKQVREIESRVEKLAVAAYNLSSGTTPRNEKPTRKRELAAAVAALRDYLDKNPPSNNHLVPNGPEYPGPNTKVAAQSNAK